MKTWMNWAGLGAGLLALLMASPDSMKGLVTIGSGAVAAIGNGIALTFRRKA